MKKKSIVLHIDSADSEKILVAITIGKKRYIKISSSTNRKAQAVLPLIEELVKKHGLALTDISSVEVNTGPGSFTGLRVGAAVANTLSWSLGIPVNGKIKEPVVPKYPEITHFEANK